MNIYLTCICLAGILLILARSFGGKLPRFIAWLGVLLAIATMHLVANDSSGFNRMITLCTVLMAGMKWIVYREWSYNKGQKCRQLSWCRWWIFSTMWFGMDPTCFAGKRRVLAWRNHAVVGVSCILTGGIFLYACFYYEVSNIVLLFIPMSMAFHFGVLRLSTAFWRYFGFPVRVLFRNPLAMRGFRDFWSKRWNLAYSEMMARTVKQPLQPLIGERWSVFAVFLISGLLHELAITLQCKLDTDYPRSSSSFTDSSL